MQAWMHIDTYLNNRVTRRIGAWTFILERAITLLSEFLINVYIRPFNDIV